MQQHIAFPLFRNYLLLMQYKTYAVFCNTPELDTIISLFSTSFTKMRFIILFLVCITSGIICTPIDMDDNHSLEVLKREDKRCTPAISRRDVKLCPATCGPNAVCRKRVCLGGECCTTVAECVPCIKDVVCIALAGCEVRTDIYGCQGCYCKPVPVFDLPVATPETSK